MNGLAKEMLYKFHISLLDLASKHTSDDHIEKSSLGTLGPDLQTCTA